MFELNFQFFFSEFRSLKPRIILMAYPTSLSQYGQECVDEELTIEKRASKLMKDLNQLDLSKPTIFVGHSMGGLIIKSIITQGKNLTQSCETTSGRH